MKTAFSVWEDRIAPVFDTAAHLVVAEVTAGQFSKEAWVLIPTDDRSRQAARLAELGVTTLVCGAVSRDLQNFLVTRGIRLVPFVAGDLRTVMNAWLEGRLNSADFAMPGCCGRRRLRCGRRRHETCGWNGKGRTRSGRISPEPPAREA